ncbi:MAG TPA: hypothetical protein VF037_01330 [Gemmatimonadales bacterium]
MSRTEAMMRRGHWVGAIACLATACASERGTLPVAVAFRDSAGIRIAENPAPDERLPRWDIPDSALLDIGGAEEGPAALARITTAYWDGSGRIVVADNGAGEIRRFDPEGDSVDAFGGRGEGPGEFRFIARVWGVGDSTWAYDPILRRISVFDAGGQIARTISIAGIGRPYSLEPLEGGRLAMSFLQSDTSGATSGPTVRLPHTVAIASSDVTRLDTVLVLPGLETYPVLGQEGEASFPAEQFPVFGRSSVVHAVGGRLYAATNESFELREFDAGGAPKRFIRVLVPAQPVRPEDRAEQLEQSLRAIDEFNAQAPEALREQWRRIERERRVAAEFPFIGEFLVAPSGEFWVEEYGWRRAAARRYLVFDSAGRLVARAEAPLRARPLALRDDAMLAVWRDADDIEHLRVYPVRRPGGAPAHQEKP